MNGMCAEAHVACDRDFTETGGKGTKNATVNIGTSGPKFTFWFNAYQMPDQFNVFLPNGTRIFSRLAGTPSKPNKNSPHCYCGECKGQTFANIVYPSPGVVLDRPRGVSAFLVSVNGYCTGTGWQFRVACAKTI
jgi:hypothetical protein